MLVQRPCGRKQMGASEEPGKSVWSELGGHVGRNETNHAREGGKGRRGGV